MEAECFEEENFIKLAQSGFYDNCPIYKIEKGYLAISGDPSGTGKSGTQSYFELTQQKPSIEIDRTAIKKKYECKRGSVGLLRGSKSGKVGSQFFVMFSDKYPEMARTHVMVGFIEDEQFLSKLETVKCDFYWKPLDEVKLTQMNVLHCPYAEILNLSRKFVQTNENVSNTSSKRELSEVERQIVEKAYVAKLPIDLDKSLSTRFLWIGNLNAKSDPRDLQTLLETKLDCKLKSFVYKVYYAFIEFETVGHCDIAYERLKLVVIDDFKLKVDYHFPDLPLHNKRIKS